jgi:coproporphyrinogen III oxidase
MGNADTGMREKMQALVYATQTSICAALAELDGSGPFRVDTWTREAGGGGQSCVLQNGRVFEKAGVNVSVVHGTLTPQAAQSMGGGQALTRPEDLTFFATGISLVLHPHNPMVPTVHANYRYFERGDGKTPAAWWFGGGADLTPSYLFEEDVRHFHGVHKAACDRHDPAFYATYKAWADKYFHIPHRGETRGVGGIFFDNLCDRDPDALLAFVADCAQSFVPSYLPLVQRRMDMPFGEAERAWQQMRRGRYVEFNLVYDRGTTFGLRTAGRIESILMSLPLTARWEYCPEEPLPQSAEARLLAATRTPQDWV